MNEFERIAQKAIEEAEFVQVSFDEFIDGLKDIIDALSNRHIEACAERRTHRRLSREESDE